MDFYFTATEFGIVLEPPQYRPIKGECPGCGVDEDAWCFSDCTMVDPMDFR